MPTKYAVRHARDFQLLTMAQLPVNAVIDTEYEYNPITLWFTTPKPLTDAEIATLEAHDNIETIIESYDQPETR